MAQPVVKLLGDLTGTAIGATPTLTDYSSSLELGPDGQPVELEWGRGDEKGSVTPSQFSFILDNTNGAFTTGASIVKNGAFFRVLVTLNGDKIRCSGYVDSTEPIWPGGSTSYCQLRVNCTDIHGRTAEAKMRLSLLEQEILALSPDYYFPLDEDPQSLTTVDLVSGYVAEKANALYGATSATFGTPLTGLFDESRGVTFTDISGTHDGFDPKTVLSIVNNSSAGPFVPANGAHSLLCFIITPEAPTSDAYNTIWAQVSGDNKAENYLHIELSSGKLEYICRSDNGSTFSFAITPASVCDGQLHMVVGTLASDQKTVSLFLDGELVDSDVAASAMSFTTLRYNSIGGCLLHTGVAGLSGQYKGTIGVCAQFPTALTAAQVKTLWDMSQGDAPIERTDQRFSRLLDIMGFTSASLPTGFGTMGGQQVRGKTFGETLREVADTEGGPVYATRSGEFTFQTRVRRLYPTSSFTVTGEDLIGTGLNVREDRVGLINSQEVHRPGGATQVAENATSQGLYGVHDGEALNVAPTTDLDALNNARWIVQTNKDPKRRISNLPIDLLTQPSSSLVESILNAYISDSFTVSGLPSQMPGGTSIQLFLEGAKETIGAKVWTIEPYTSPTSAIPNTLRAGATASAKTKLDSGLKFGF